MTQLSMEAREVRRRYRREYLREYQRKWRQKPENKEKQKEYERRAMSESCIVQWAVQIAWRKINGAKRQIKVKGQQKRAETWAV